jgi:hypothetical protein
LTALRDDAEGHARGLFHDGCRRQSVECIVAIARITKKEAAGFGRRLDR